MKALRAIRQLITGELESTNPNKLKKLHHAALVWEDDEIIWFGKDEDLPKNLNITEEYLAEKFIVSPGFIDCHTHLAFGGNRWDETTLKLLGTSYLEIAQSGGGIKSTVKATRNSDTNKLKNRAQTYLDLFAQEGVTSIEAKTGYGLNLEHEIRVLSIYNELSLVKSNPRISKTLLAAHTIPEEFANHRTGFIDLICKEIIPKVAKLKLAEFCDVFVEKGAFSFDEAALILKRGQEFGLKSKIHIDQLSDQKGGILSELTQAVSADHLEYISDDSILALKRANTVAVSLPTATLFLNQPAMPARKMLELGIPVAVASDFNPGSAPIPSLLHAMNLAALIQRMTADEILLGVTKHAAKALSKENELGLIKPGFKADFTLFSHDSLEELIYGAGKTKGEIKRVLKGELDSAN